MDEVPVTCRGELIFYANACYWWVLSIELASCHPSGTDILRWLLGKICAPLNYNFWVELAFLLDRFSYHVLCCWGKKKASVFWSGTENFCMRCLQTCKPALCCCIRAAMVELFNWIFSDNYLLITHAIGKYCDLYSVPFQCCFRSNRETNGNLSFFFFLLFFFLWPWESNVKRDVSEQQYAILR